MMENKNITKNDIEFYLLNREFSELTNDEKIIVKEYVASEQEFNEMKAMLLGVDVFLKEEKELEPNPAIKAALLREFEQQKPAGRYWLNGVVISLFPKEKKLYQKPGIQLIGLAASVLLIVSIFINGNNDLNKMELAQNEQIIIEEKLIDSTVQSDDSKKEMKDIEKERAQKEENVIEQDVTVETIVLNAASGYSDQPNDGVSVGDLKDDVDAETSFSWANDGKEINSVEKELAEEEESVSRSVDNLVISSSTEPTITVAEEISMEDDTGGELYKAKTSSNAPLVAGGIVDLPKNSRSLAEDSDLIGILYTSM